MIGRKDIAGALVKFGMFEACAWDVAMRVDGEMLYADSAEEVLHTSIGKQTLGEYLIIAHRLDWGRRGLHLCGPPEAVTKWRKLTHCAADCGKCAGACGEEERTADLSEPGPEPDDPRYRQSGDDN